MAEVLWLLLGMTLGSALTVLFLWFQRNRRNSSRPYRISKKAPHTAQVVRKNTSPKVTRITRARIKTRARRTW